MKITKPLTAAALAMIATAQAENYGCNSASRNRSTISHPQYNITRMQYGMPQFINPFQRNNRATDTPRRISSLCSSIGSTVQPGKVLSKADRQRRRETRADSAFDNLDGQADEKLDYETEHNWKAFKAKLAANVKLSDCLKRLDQDIEESFIPGACTAFVTEYQSRIQCYSLRSLIVLIIWFLIVFGALYTFFEYLLFKTRVSACSVSTVYIPIPYTVTSSAPFSSPIAASNSTASILTYISTTTQTSTFFETETVTSFLSAPPGATSAAAETTGGGPSYVYSINSAGSTVWENGMSPSSGAIVSTVTSTVTMEPVPLSDPGATAQSNLADIPTVTPPAYTSTIYSYAGPDITSTSTSTHYVTRTVSQVGPLATITTTRTSFPGISSGGWNASSSNDPVSAAAETSDPITTTITAVSYFGNGDEITSTKTMFITTTVARIFTTTLYPAVQSPFGSGYVTTITALPVTITPPLFSTNTPFLNTSSIFTTLSSAAAGPDTATSKSISQTYSMNATTSAQPSNHPQITSASSAVFQNSSSSAAPTGASVLPSNTTFVFTTKQSSKGSILKTPGTGSSPKTITNTISAAALTGSQHATTLMPISSSSSASRAGAVNTTANITSTFSNLGSSASPKTEISTTESVTPSARPHTGNSPISGGPFSSGSDTSTTFLTVSRQFINSTSSSVVYGYPNSGPSSFAGISTLPSVANSFTSESTTNVPRPATPSGSPSPSTLATSTRSPAKFNSSSLSPGHGTASPSSPTQISITATSSSAAQPPESTNAPTSLAPNVTTTSTSASNAFPPSSATATPTGGCGEQGPFMVNFDDLPRFLPTNPNATTITEAPPVPNPYHHLTFSNGYVYAPEPSEPYQPVSPPHLAVFLANATGKTASPFGSLVKPGEIGDGPRDAISAFWFDATSAFFGCDNLGPDACTLVLSAYTWSQAANAETIAYKQNVTIPACKTLTSLNCQLQKVEFPPTFRGLTGLQVQAFTGNDQRMFFMDNLALAWTNTSCAAGLLRQSSV